MKLIVDLNSSLKAHPNLLGGKALNLAWLGHQGFCVPPWFVVTTASFRIAIEAAMSVSYSEVMARLKEDPLPEAAKIYDALIKLTLPESVARELKDRLSGWKSEFFAVRSSVVGEDSIEASFAGQMDTFLFLKSFEDIAKATMSCFASAFGERAIRYRIQNSLPIDSIAAAVICQEMIDSDVSGVVFTAHPVRGSRSEQLISAAWGLGEGIVSGECNADEWVVTCNPEVAISERAIADKDTAVRFNRQKGYGTILEDLDGKLRLSPCLSDEQILELAKVCHEVALAKGYPQDIEFAFASGRLALLQTRPITSLPECHEGDTVVWDNSNIQESYCGVTTPLTFSFASRAYHNVYRCTGEIMGLKPSELDAMDVTLRNLLGLIQGRVYYNINNWYLGLTGFPSFGSNKEDMERMMGLQDPVDFVFSKHIKGIAGLREKLRAGLALARLIWKFSRIKTLVREFRGNFASVYDSIDRKRLFLADTSALFKLTKQLEEKLIKRWTTPIINDFYVMMMNGSVHRKLQSIGINNVPLALNNLLSGEEGIESTEPTKYLLKLCDEIRENPSLHKTIVENSNSSIMAILQVENPDFFAKCQTYVELYGDRTIGELKLESVTLREDTAFMFACIRNYLDNDKLSLKTLQRHELDLRLQEEERVFVLVRKKKGRRALSRLKRDLNRLREAVKNRENMRLARTRLFGLYRSIYLEMGKQLAIYKKITNPTDIFYLSVDEIEQYFEGRSICLKLGAMAKLRQEEFESYKGDDLPHHFHTRGSPYLGNAYVYPGAAVEQGAHLKGLGCYPGVVQGKLRLIFSPDDELSLMGQILCTVRTDPGWAPLFPSASGILVERGSSLSHSAVVARELGIPAIVNIPGLTKIVKDGELVKMDGQAGTIERLGID